MEISHSFVVTPRETDILSGRGGLSNNHPGNDLFRQLIRSTRPLYRACPKFTKLHLSKAIVEIIQEEGGRFLARTPNREEWGLLSYAKAVQKTSQGLREKEGRDDDEKALPTVPQFFLQKGTYSQTALKDFVRVTLHQVRAIQEAKKKLLPQSFLQKSNNSDWNGSIQTAMDQGPHLPTKEETTTMSQLLCNRENSVAGCRSIGNDVYWMGEISLANQYRQEKHNLQLQAQQEELIEKIRTVHFGTNESIYSSPSKKMITSNAPVVMLPDYSLDGKAPYSPSKGGVVERLSATATLPKFHKKDSISAYSTAENERQWIDENLLLQKTINVLQQRQLRNLNLMNNASSVLSSNS